MLKVLSRSLPLIIIIFLLVLAAMFFVNAEHYRARSQELRQARSVVAGTKVSEDGSTTLAQPVAIRLKGQVLTTFVGGRDLAVQSATSLVGYQKFHISGYSDLDYSAWQGSEVSIKGVMIGTTCAYAKTVFGDCVPEIMASSITKLGK
jgi:hypothetical protein